MWQHPVQELKDYLRQGIQLDELWRVARGEIKLCDFEASSSNGNGAAVAEAPQETVPDVPQDLVRFHLSSCWHARTTAPCVKRADIDI